MNRYRTLPGLGPQKANANTVCQKCLKKDIYECKSSVQQRPYASRPSRTQQLSNPKLMPKLASDNPNTLLNSNGVADQQLAEANARRTGLATETGGPRASTLDAPADQSDSDTVSTISTSRSLSPSHSRSRGRKDDFLTSGHASRQRSRTPDIPRKRKHRSISSSISRSPRSPRREPGSHRKNRRHRTISPDDRGRPSSMRRGSHRSRSNSPSMDKSQITKQRRSLDVQDDLDGRQSGYRRGNHDEDRPLPRSEFPLSGQRQNRGRKERSLSPYSRRLALTQAMNL